MQIGHVEGKGAIYDEYGELVLRPGERLVIRIDDDNVHVSEGSGFWNMKTLFHRTAERGNLFITDKRLVLLRKPDPFLAAKYDAYPLGMADAVANAVRAMDLKRMHSWEFCQIDFAEVEGFRVKEHVAGVLFLRSSPQVTRKALLYRKDKSDRKLYFLRDIISKRLPMTEPEDRKGNFLLGARYPFLYRGRHRSVSDR